MELEAELAAKEEEYETAVTAMRETSTWLDEHATDAAAAMAEKEMEHNTAMQTYTKQPVIFVLWRGKRGRALGSIFNNFPNNCSVAGQPASLAASQAASQLGGKLPGPS